MDGITAMISDKNKLQEEIATLIKAFQNKHNVPRISNIGLNYLEITMMEDSDPKYLLQSVKITVQI